MSKWIASGRSTLCGAVAGVVLAACGGGGGSTAPVAPVPVTAPGTGNGTVRVALTDAPACGYDQVNVTVERVRFHMSAAAGDNEAGWTDIILNPVRKIDLLTLTNGVIADLGQTTLPAGLYTQIRLVLSPNGGGSPANSVVPRGGSEMPLATPSGTQSGLKLINRFTVEPGKLTDVLLDFDACKSIVQRGNGSFGLKPVIHVIPRTGAAIAGDVETGLTGITVSAQKNGVVLRATQPNSTGQFLLAPVDPTKAPYDIVVTGAGLTSAVITGVPGTQDQTTTVSSLAAPVTMPTSPVGTVNGIVGPAAAAATGSVRALQSVSATTMVEVAHTNTNPTTGEYSLTLPTAAPRLMSYSNPVVTPLPLVAQDPRAAKYTLEAAATGYVAKLGSEITVSSSTPPTGQDFTLVVAP